MRIHKLIAQRITSLNHIARIKLKDEHADRQVPTRPTSAEIELSDESLHPRSESAGRSNHLEHEASPSADLILPLLIYSLVYANPPLMVSTLHYVQNYYPADLLQAKQRTV